MFTGIKFFQRTFQDRVGKRKKLHHFPVNKKSDSLPCSLYTQNRTKFLFFQFKSTVVNSCSPVI